MTSAVSYPLTAEDMHVLGFRRTRNPEAAIRRNHTDNERDAAVMAATRCPLCRDEIEKGCTICGECAHD